MGGGLPVSRPVCRIPTIQSMRLLPLVGHPVPVGCSTCGSERIDRSTAAPLVLRDELSVTEFVNSDRLRFESGRIMLRRLDQLAEQRAEFAFETRWPASRSARSSASSWSPAMKRISILMGSGSRVEIRRRCVRRISNFFNLYRSLPVSWESMTTASTHQQ
jgi:hypothetical protein